MKRDPHDPEGEFERRNYKLGHMVDDVFCAREGVVVHGGDIIGEVFEGLKVRDAGKFIRDNIPPGPPDEFSARESYDAAKEWYDFDPPKEEDEVTRLQRILFGPKTITDLVHKVIDQREKIGMATYHRPLLAGDGRDTLQDAIEEAADLLQYLVKLKVEREGTGG
jgi:hypothetical protein